MKITRRQIRQVIFEEAQMLNKGAGLRLTVMEAILASAFPIALAAYSMSPEIQEGVNDAFDHGIVTLNQWLENMEEDWRAVIDQESK